MPPLTSVIAIGVSGLILYAAFRALLAALARSGRDAERAMRAEADLAIAKRQGEIIAEQRTSDDVAKRLDGGDF